MEVVCFFNAVISYFSVLIFKPTESFVLPESICEDLCLAVASVDRRSVWKWGEQVCRGEKTLNALIQRAVWRLAYNLSEALLQKKDEEFISTGND